MQTCLGQAGDKSPKRSQSPKGKNTGTGGDAKKEDANKALGGGKKQRGKKERVELDGQHGDRPEVLSALLTHQS